MLRSIVLSAFVLSLSPSVSTQEMLLEAELKDIARMEQEGSREITMAFILGARDAWFEMTMTDMRGLLADEGIFDEAHMAEALEIVHNCIASLTVPYLYDAAKAQAHRWPETSLAGYVVRLLN